MPRPRARLHFPKTVRRYRAAFGVEAVDEDLVEPQVAREHEAVVRITIDAVSMSGFLTAAVGALAPVLVYRCRTFEGPVVLDPIRRHAAAGVIGCEHRLASGIDRDVGRSGAGRGLLVEQL